MSKQIIGREKAVEALASLCRDYRGIALKAVRQGGEEVFIPANPSDPEGMLEALANPEGMVQFESQGNDAHKEPCYASLIEYLDGRNADGTEHAGYLAVDVVAKVVTGFKDRTGRSVVPKVRPLDTGHLLSELTGRPDSYCL